MSQDKDCIFCKIIKGKLPSDIVYEDDEVIGFRDINPIAPVHILVIPRKHIPTIHNISRDDLPLIGHMITAANQIAGEQGIADGGYRLIFNHGDQAGQTVHHIHLHVLGGRPLSWTT